MPRINDNEIEFKFKHAPYGAEEVKERLAQVSPRAQALYERLAAGEWYYAYAEKTPVCMKELLEARLVTTKMRCPQYHLSYVPAHTLAANFEFFTQEHQLSIIGMDEMQALRDGIERDLMALAKKRERMQALYTAHRVIG